MLFGRTKTEPPTAADNAARARRPPVLGAHHPCRPRHPRVRSPMDLTSPPRARLLLGRGEDVLADPRRLVDVGRVRGRRHA